MGRGQPCGDVLRTFTLLGAPGTASCFCKDRVPGARPPEGTEPCGCPAHTCSLGLRPQAHAASSWERVPRRGLSCT